MADSVRVWNVADCRKYLPKPKPTDHKYRRGVLTCITGSKKYPGAALLTTASALAVGIGMVRYLGPKSVQRAVILNRPEIVLQKGNSDAYVIGSGLARDFSIIRKLEVSEAIKMRKPIVLDAGALRYAGKTKAPAIITPHVGELAKLLKFKSTEIESDPKRFAKLAAEIFNVTVLLKGHKTIVANTKGIIELPDASNRLATAGTGDVLAGILGALLALNNGVADETNLIEIGATASFIHARSAEKIPVGPLTASQLIDLIPKVVTDISK